MRRSWVRGPHPHRVIRRRVGATRSRPWARKLPLGIRRDHLVAVGDQKPGRQRLPGRDAHHLSRGAPVQRLLDREHDLDLGGVDVGREVVDEVVFGQPGEAVLVDVEMRQGGPARCLVQQGADRFALIQPERGDVDRPTTLGVSVPSAVITVLPCSGPDRPVRSTSGQGVNAMHLLADLLELARRGRHPHAHPHRRQRIWAIEGTGGYGAGLTRFLTANAEQVGELDPPKRAARRHRAKSDPWTPPGPPARPWAATSSPSPGPRDIPRRSRRG
jgi:hypothetical protein